jgi:hypothetical protein
MRIDPAVLKKTIAEGIAALDGAILELAAHTADAEAERLERNADHSTGTVCNELRAGARAARRIAISIRELKEAE